MSTVSDKFIYRCPVCRTPARLDPSQVGTLVECECCQRRLRVPPLPQERPTMETPVGNHVRRFPFPGALRSRFQLDTIKVLALPHSLLGILSTVCGGAFLVFMLLARMFHHMWWVRLEEWQIAHHKWAGLSISQMNNPGLHAQSVACAWIAVICVALGLLLGLCSLSSKCQKTWSIVGLTVNGLMLCILIFVLGS